MAKYKFYSNDDGPVEMFARVDENGDVEMKMSDGSWKSAGFDYADIVLKGDWEQVSAVK